MDKELLEESAYAQIIENQVSILQEVEGTNLTLNNVNELSNRFVGEAFTHFKQGTEAITRIRANLDQIHKHLSVIKKRQKQLQK